MLKVDLDFSTSKIKSLIDKIWKNKQISKKWKQGIIIKLPKKENLKKCKNWRGIALLPIVSRVLTGILINRIREGVDHKPRKEQAGFRAGHGTMEQIFILKNIIEQTNEWPLPELHRLRKSFQLHPSRKPVENHEVIWYTR